MSLSLSLSLEPSTTVADAVLAHPECVHVFTRHRIDYCCGGRVSIARACESRGLDPAGVMAELRAALESRRGPRPFDPRAMSTAALAAHVIQRHHGYLREAMPVVNAMAAKVARVHGEKDARLGELSREVSALVETLGPHLDREERVLFPAMMSAVPGSTLRGEAGAELAHMATDHVAVGDALGRVRALTDGFTPPVWACITYRTLLRELASMEADVHEHVHLENNVLAPRFGAA